MSENSYKQSIDEAVKEIDKIDQKLVDLATHINQLGDEAKKSLAFLTPKSSSKLDEQLNDVKKSLNGISNAEKKVGDAMSQRMDKLRRLADQNSIYSKQHIQDQKRMQKETLKGARVEKKAANDKIRAAKKAAAADAKQVVNKRALAKAADLEAKSTSKLVGAYGNLIAKRDKAKKNLLDLVASQKASTKQIEKAQKEYDQYTARVKKADAATKSFAVANKSRIRGLTSVVGNLMGAFGFVGGLYLFAEFSKRGFQLAKTLDSLHFSMETIIQDTYEIARAQAFLADISERYGAGIVKLTERYIKFTAAAKNSGLQTDEIESIFNSFAKISGVLGYSQESLDSIFLALEQMISKGTISAEELRQQLGEKLPGAFGIMVKAVQQTNPELNATDENLINLMRRGEIIAGEVLPEFARQAELALGVENLTRVENLAASTTRLSNAWVGFMQNLTESEGAISKSLTTIINAFTGVLTIIEKVNTTMGEFMDLGKTKGSVQMTKTLKKDVEELDFTMQRAAEVRLPGLIASLEDYQNKLKELKEDNLIDGGLLGDLVNNQKVKQMALIVEKYREMVRVAKEAAGVQTMGPQPQSQGTAFSLYLEPEKEEETNDILTDRKKIVDKLADAVKRYNSTDKDKKETRAIIKKEIDELNKQLSIWDLNTDAISGNNETKEKSIEIMEGSIAAFEAYISEQQELRDKTALTTEEVDKFNENIANADISIKRLKEGISAAMDIDISPMGIETSFTSDSSGLEEQVDTFAEASDMKQAIAKRETDILESFYNKQVQDAIDAGAGDDELDALRDKHQQRLDIVQKALDKEKEIYGNLADSVKELGVSIMEARVEQVEQEIFANKEKYAKILDNENLTEEQRSAIEAERDKKEIELEKKKRKREKESFLVSKAFAVADIIINTSRAIMATLGQTGFLGIPLTAVVAAMGAVQLATVVAQSIPKFEKGTENAPEGVALVDEKRPEVHTDKYGNVKSFGMRESNLRYLEKGDKIYKSHDHFFNSFNETEVQKAVWDMNLRSNGRDISESQVDYSLLKEMSGMRKDFDRMGRRFEKIASRPINNKVTVELDDKRAY